MNVCVDIEHIVCCILQQSIYYITSWFVRTAYFLTTHRSSIMRKWLLFHMRQTQLQTVCALAQSGLELSCQLFQPWNIVCVTFKGIEKLLTRMCILPIFTMTRLILDLCNLYHCNLSLFFLRGLCHRYF